MDQRREKEGAQWKTLDGWSLRTEVDVHVFLTGNDDDDSDANFANHSGRMFRISD